MVIIKKIVRSIIGVLLFGFFGIGAIVVRYGIIPFKKSIEEKRKVFQKSWIFFVWLLETLKMIKLKIDNPDEIKNIKNSIVVSTHPSFIDIVILMSIIPNATCFVGERLANNIFFKGMIELFFIKESSTMDSWLDESCKVLDKDMNLIIFPAGIRHKKDEFPKIRRGVAIIAQKSKKNVAMIRMSTSFNFLNIHQPFYEAGSEPVIYNIEYLGVIDIPKFIEEYPDEVTLKTKIVRNISETLYNY